MAGHPLRPATDRCLGEPLPHQLANQTRAPLLAINLSPLKAHPVLATVSSGCPRPKGRFSRVTHPSATNPRKDSFDLHVLGIPPAFILSQDQTLHFEIFWLPHTRKCEAFFTSWLTGYPVRLIFLTSIGSFKTFKLLVCLGSGRWEVVVSFERIYQCTSPKPDCQPLFHIFFFTCRKSPSHKRLHQISHPDQG